MFSCKFVIRLSFSSSVCRLIKFENKCRSRYLSLFSASFKISRFSNVENTYVFKEYKLFLAKLSVCNRFKSAKMSLGSISIQLFSNRNSVKSNQSWKMLFWKEHIKLCPKDIFMILLALKIGKKSCQEKIDCFLLDAILSN